MVGAADSRRIERRGDRFDMESLKVKSPALAARGEGGGFSTAGGPGRGLTEVWRWSPPSALDLGDYGFDADDFLNLLEDLTAKAMDS
ncbi:hypothetical protein NL676_030398 [Syzygium grande]|nr:hypothetical protein NL676_030398 [Syzygium grande]